MRFCSLLRVCGALTVALPIGHATAMQPGSTGQAPCTPVDCSGVTTAPFPVPSGYGLVPDERPLSFIMTWAHANPANPIGLENKWYDDDLTNPAGPPTDVLGSDLEPGANGIPDAFDWLLRGLNRRFDAGFRRIGLYLPAGTPLGQHLMASSQWWTMPQWKRDGFMTYVKPWLLSKSAHNQPVSLGIYAGFDVVDPCKYGMSHAVPNPYDAVSMCLFHQNIQPWIDVGAKEYWFDTAAMHPVELEIIQQSPLYRDIIRFGGESIPFIDIAPGNACTGNRTPDPSTIYDAPYTGLFREVRGRFRHDYAVDPMTTDLNVMLSGHTSCDVNPGYPNANHVWTFAEVKDMYHSGWTIQLQGHYGTNQHQLVKGDASSIYAFDYSPFDIGLEAVYRLYDFGTLKSLLDYDNDGLNEVDTATAEDYIVFFNAWLANVNQPGGYLDGDCNGSGTVDLQDLYDYEDARADWNTVQKLTPVDLGPAWWH